MIVEVQGRTMSKITALSFSKTIQAMVYQENVNSRNISVSCENSSDSQGW